MRYEISKKRLVILIVIFPLTVLLIYGITSYLFLSYIQQNDIEKEIKNYEKSFIDIESERLKEKVNALTQYINYYNEKSSDKIKKDIRTIVNVSADTANNIYKKYRGRLEWKDIQQIILAALKDIKYGDDYGHLFVLNKRGYAHMHYDKKLEKKVIIDVQDDFGRKFVREFNRVIEEEGSGFVGYNWYKPGSNTNKMHYKITYIKKLKCYKWYIGAGVYVEEIEKEAKKDILKYLQTNALFNNGYFFIVDGDEKLVFHPDKNQKLDLKQFKKTGYHIDDKNMYQISYIDNYDWYIVAARSLAHIGQNMERKINKSNDVREETMKQNLLYLGLAWFISILLSLYLSMIIYKQIRSYEEQINQSNDKMMFQSKQALIGELFSMIAHQWRQPINKIASIVALIRFELENDKISKTEIDNSCEEIEDSIEFMSETIDDFRTFYKPTTSTKLVNLKTLITRSIFFLKSSIQKNDIKIIKQLEDIEIELYRNEFLQVMLNLIKNAIDAVGSQGVVIIKLYKEVDKVIISVENSGKSIDKEVMKKIFEPYFTTKDESMGLGLYMTKIIVEKHMKGEIMVERLKDGTKFTIML
jgi:signal transduction histidine kinase